PATRETCAVSLHDALPIWVGGIGIERLRQGVLGAQLRVGVAEARLDRVAVEEQAGVLDAGLFQRGLDPAEHRLFDLDRGLAAREDRKSTRLNSSHVKSSYA